MVMLASSKTTAGDIAESPVYAIASDFGESCAPCLFFGRTKDLGCSQWHASQK